MFGSLASGFFTEWSDIDITVWGVSGKAFFSAVVFAKGFSDKFKIDIIDAEDCPSNLFSSIEKEGIEI